MRSIASVWFLVLKLLGIHSNRTDPFTLALLNARATLRDLPLRVISITRYQQKSGIYTFFSPAIMVEMRFSLNVSDWIRVTPLENHPIIQCLRSCAREAPPVAYRLLSCHRNANL